MVVKKKSENDTAGGEQPAVKKKKRWSGRMLNSGKKANATYVEHSDTTCEFYRADSYSQYCGERFTITTPFTASGDPQSHLGVRS